VCNCKVFGKITYRGVDDDDDDDDHDDDDDNNTALLVRK